MEKITTEFIASSLNLQISRTGVFDALGLSNATHPNSLTFLDNRKFLQEVLQNTNITGIITLASYEEEILKKKSNLTVIVSDDPRHDFFVLQNLFAEAAREKNTVKSQIHPSAKIHSTAYIAEFNVVIGENVIVEPHVSVLEDVEIGANSIIRAGVVLGAEGFEHKRTSKGILSVKHDGKVIIGKNVEIGSNSAVSKGFIYRNTTLGDETKLDNLVHVAHGVQIGKRCFLPASCMIAGSTTIEDDVWIGPNASISSQLHIGQGAFVTLGSVVTKNVEPGGRMTGNFAIPHGAFMRILKKSLDNVKGEVKEDNQ